MAAIVARPPLVSAALLLGLSLLGGHEPAPRQSRSELGAVPAIPRVDMRDPSAWNGGPLRPSYDVIETPAMADADDWPRGMVMGRHARPVDRMNTGVVAQWLSGFLTWLASQPA